MDALKPRGRGLLFFCLLTATPAALRAAPTLSQFSGPVYLRPSGGSEWQPVEKAPQGLVRGDSLRTDAGGRAVILFDDGTRIEMGARASFSLRETGKLKTLLNLTAGSLQAAVRRGVARWFIVQTPTAIASVRGTEFIIEVAGQDKTIVDLYSGKLDVEDLMGKTVALAKNQRLEITLQGAGEPTAIPPEALLEHMQKRVRDQIDGDADLKGLENDLKRKSGGERKFTKEMAGDVERVINKKQKGGMSQDMKDYMEGMQTYSREPGAAAVEQLKPGYQPKAPKRMDPAKEADLEKRINEAEPLVPKP